MAECQAVGKFLYQTPVMESEIALQKDLNFASQNLVKISFKM